MNLLVLFSIISISCSLIDSYVTETELEEFAKRISPYKADQGHSRIKRKLFGDSFHTKESIKEAFEKEFEGYEKCLNEREEERKSSENTIHGLLALEGQKVRLSCNLCPRPDQDLTKLEIIDWQRLRPQDSDFEFVSKDDGRVRIDGETRDLIIDPVDVLDAGQYFCINTYYREYEEIYQLDVLFRERLKTTKYEDVEGGKDKYLDDFYLEDHNILAFTAWSEWTECQDCNKKSIKKRVGLCMVTKIHRDQPILPFDLPIIELYPIGVPCRSTVLSKEIASIKRIKNRRSEVNLADCYKVCPTTPGYTIVTDKNGSISEVFEAGFYPLNSKPKLPPMVIRRVLFEPINKHLILSCPRSQKYKSLIRWQNGSLVLNPLTIKRQTRGRVFLDSINRLHIRRLRMTDTAPYNCWSSRVHIATIKVIVTDARIDVKVKEYITYAGLFLTVFSIFLICVCVLCKKKKKTAK